MSLRGEVLIRILSAITKQDVNWNKKSYIKMLKMALFDCAINEKCCSVDGGRGICPLFSAPPRGIWQLNSPHPWEFAIQGPKNANARGSARGGGGGWVGPGGIDWCRNLANQFLIGQVQYIKILTWLHGFLGIFLYLVWFSLCSIPFWELWDNGLMKNLQFWP